MGKNKTKSSAVSNALSKDQITLKWAIKHYSPRGVTDEQIQKMSPFYKKGDTLFFGTVEGNCVLILQIAKDNYVGKKLSLKRLVNASGTNDITILCDAIYRMSGTKISQKEALKIKPFYKRGGVVIYGYPMGYNVIVTRIQKGVCETGKVSFK